MKTYARRFATVGALTVVLAGGLLAGGTPTASAAPMPEICKVKNFPFCDQWRR